MDIERLLGVLVQSKLRKRSSGNMLRKAAFSKEGITLLAGIGIAAYEHFRSRQQTGTPPQPPATPAAPPPFPGAAQPPATPPAFAKPSATPPLSEPDLILRAMVLATLADGRLDAEERDELYTQLDRAGGTDVDRVNLDALIENPGTLEELAAQVKDRAEGAEIYAAARLAIDPDTAAEQRFLADLARHLGLDDAAIAEIEARLDEAAC